MFFSRTAMQREPSATTGNGGCLPPLAGGARAGSAALLSKLGPGSGLTHGGSRDCSGPPAGEGSDLSVARSALSGSSKAPFPPDRTGLDRDFGWTKNSRDLPAEVRPIIEDNRMLREELRRYRQRLGEQEGLLSAHERTITALRDELLRERQRVRDCSVSPAQLLQDQAARQALQERDATIRQLQQRAGIMERAKDAAQRRLASDAAAERRQQAELRRQMQALRGDVEEKAQQLRFSQLHINTLVKRQHELEAALAAAAQPVVAPPPPPPLEECARLMLCMVYAQPQPTAAEIAEAAAKLAAEEQARVAEQRAQQQAAAAVRIQAAARGVFARRRLAARHAAATTIQAAVRGMLARQALGPLLQLQRQPVVSDASADLPHRAAPAHHLLGLAERQRAAERQHRERAAANKCKTRQRLPALPHAARPASTAVGTAARLRGEAGGEAAAAWPSLDGAPRRSSAVLHATSDSLGRHPVPLPGAAGGSGGSMPRPGGGMPGRHAEAPLGGPAVRRPSNLMHSSGSPLRREFQHESGSGSAGTARQHNQQSVSPVPRLDLAAMHHRGSGNGGMAAGKRRTSIVGFASGALRQSGAGGRVALCD